MKKTMVVGIVAGLFAGTSVASADVPAEKSCGAQWELGKINAFAYSTPQSEAMEESMRMSRVAKLAYVILPGELAGATPEALAIGAGPSASMTVVPGQVVEWCFVRTMDISAAALDLQIHQMVPEAQDVEVKEVRVGPDGERVLAASYRVTTR